MATYGIDDMTIKLDNVDGDFSGDETDLTAKLDFTNTIMTIKTAALIDEYRVAGGVWMVRKASGQKQWTDKWVLAFVYEPGGSPDLDDLFYNEGAVLGIDTTWLRITLGGAKTITQKVVVEDYERIPSVEKLHRSKVTLAQDGAPTEA